jgi:outer membrane protein
MLSILFAALWIPALGMAQTPAATTPAAQTPAIIGPAKIAWMNLEAALLTTDEGKGMYAEIQRYVEDKQKEMDNMRKESDKLKSQLEVQGAKLTDEARAKLEEDIDDRDTKIQRFQQDTQKDIENRRSRMTNYLGRRMQQVVQNLAKEKGLSAILIFNQGRDAYVDQSLDVTEELVKAYNQKYAAGAAKAPAAPPAPATPAPKKP